MFLKHVIQLYEKFNLTNKTDNSHRKLSEEEIRFRVGFLFEELFETTQAFGLELNPHTKNSLIESIKTSHINLNKYNDEEVIDGLLDLVYVAFGTLISKELPEDQIREHQEEIQRANLEKKPVTNTDDTRQKRKYHLDLFKPPGWKGPNHTRIIEKYAKNKLRNKANEK